MTAATVKNIIENASPPHEVTVDLLRGDQVKLQGVKWLWNGWLARGKLHILAGAPGTGKTTIAMALAATLTSGGNWPDSTPAPLGDVLIWSGEDDPADTLAPRLKAMGADMSRIYFVNDVTDAQGRRSFDPAIDIGALARKVEEIRPGALIVDPIVSAVAGDSHKNTETRRALQPLVDLANRTGMAILGISHFSKGTAGRNPTERVTGSLAFGALPRVVMVTAKIEEDQGGGRIFCRAKSNVGADDGGFRYDFTLRKLPDDVDLVASCVTWGEAVEGSARQLLADAEAVDSEGGSLAATKEFLLAELANGPVSATEIEAAAKEACHSKATLRRAKANLGIITEKTGMKGGWMWRLPPKMLNDAEDAQQKSMSAFVDNEHLPDEEPPSIAPPCVF